MCSTHHRKRVLPWRPRRGQCWKLRRQRIALASTENRFWRRRPCAPDLPRKRARLVGIEGRGCASVVSKRTRFVSLRVSVVHVAPEHLLCTAHPAPCSRVHPCACAQPLTPSTLRRAAPVHPKRRGSGESPPLPPPSRRAIASGCRVKKDTVGVGFFGEGLSSALDSASYPHASSVAFVAHYRRPVASEMCPERDSDATYKICTPHRQTLYVANV